MKIFWYILLIAVSLPGMIAKRSHFINVCKKLATGHLLVEEIPHEQFLWVDRDGKTILHHATFYDKNGCLIQALCNTCPELIEKTDKARYSPLHTAAFHGNPFAVEALLEKKANPCAKNHTGKTPAHLVTTLNYFPIIKRILGHLASAGALVNSQDIYGNTPLHMIACQGNEDLYNYASTLLPGNNTIKNRDNYTAEHIFFTALFPDLAQDYINRITNITATSV